ncbi:MAG: pseudouridine-5'-phosphate glycosidase [Alphaproteobacteria bacterium]|nr:MAG: pseudouridine-5'-phosphate glycosidase [Alphaproteobacteria bacterium]
MTTLPITISPEVAAALEAGRPVVALETTIVTHGMPPPDNLQTALAAEAAIRAEGAVPATIAVIDGRIHVGLSPEALAALAATEGVLKLSRADLAWALAIGATGSTTVAATMICARAAGIAVFATGGIGGVHRGVEESLDISADLTELAETPVTVVSAGAKAILDLPRTLEALETRGVPVIGWRTRRFPAFWSRDSGLPVPLTAEDEGQIARAHRMRAALGLPGGQLVCNPIPEAAEIPLAEIAPAIAAAEAEARAQAIAGKALTPFLLARINAITAGRALAANRALVLANARLGARIAVAMARCGRPS